MTSSRTENSSRGPLGPTIARNLGTDQRAAPMRVAIVTIGFPRDSDRPRGGVEAAVGGMVKGLAARSPSVSLDVVVCPSGVETETTSAYGCVNVHRLPGGGPVLDILPFSPTRRRVSRLLEDLQPDVVHVHGGPQYVDGQKHRAALTTHGFTESEIPFSAHRWPGMRSRIAGAWLGYHRRRYRWQVSISEHASRHIRGGKSLVIPNPVDEAFFSLERGDCGPRILYIGPLSRLKNPSAAIKTLAALRGRGIEASLRFAGEPVDAAYADELEELAGTLELGQHVAFLGALDRQRLLQELSMARCAMLLSHQENSPMAIAETAAAGVPSVISEIVAARELVANRRAFAAVPPDDAGAVARTIEHVVASHQASMATGADARKGAAVHRLERVVDQTIDLYRAMCPKHETTTDRPREPNGLL